MFLLTRGPCSNYTGLYSTLLWLFRACAASPASWLPTPLPCLSIASQQVQKGKCPTPTDLCCQLHEWAPQDSSLPGEGCVLVHVPSGNARCFTAKAPGVRLREQPPACPLPQGRQLKWPHSHDFSPATTSAPKQTLAGVTCPLPSRNSLYNLLHHSRQNLSLRPWCTSFQAFSAWGRLPVLDGVKRVI